MNKFDFDTWFLKIVEDISIDPNTLTNMILNKSMIKSGYNWVEQVKNNVDQEDIYTVSGLNSSQQPVSIEWLYNGGETVTADSNNVTVYSTGDCIPVVVACYSSHIDITANRNVQFYS
jgi:hypothetical protein